MSLRRNLRELQFRKFRLVLGILILLLGNQLSHADEIKSGFEAQIEGAYQGKVDGAGVLVFLANAGFDKQGYYFLADGQGIRPHGLTFILPRELALGRHELTSPSPFDKGNVPSVRVDRDTGNATISSGNNTSGFILLNAFPIETSELSGSNVVGKFEFQTEDQDEKIIKVKGEFSFRVR